MADNITINPLPGTNAVVKTDQLSDGSQVQYVKILDGTEDSTTPLVVSATGLAVSAQGNVASGAADSGNPVKIGGVYRLSSPTLADGQRYELLLTPNGFLRVELASFLAGENLTENTLGVQLKPYASATYTWSTDNQMTRVTKRTSKPAPGNLFSAFVTNDNAVERYFQIHNTASAPAAAAVPVLSFKIPAGTAADPGTLKLDATILGSAGHYLSTGVSWAISTTYGTFTDSATATEHIVLVKYI